MQVLCKASNTGSDVRCPVCGQGFLLYWGQRDREERSRSRKEVLESLRAHHESDLSTSAHPRMDFTLPEWKSNSHIPSAAATGSAPVWAAAA